MNNNIYDNILYCNDCMDEMTVAEAAENNWTYVGTIDDTGTGWFNFLVRCADCSIFPGYGPIGDLLSQRLSEGLWVTWA